MGGFRKTAALLAWLVFVPAAVYAQASITGIVKDTSGAVLPGVTVEAASPALIEKTRSVVTDGTGQYRIESLRPGTYTVTFALAGFNTVKREGIELAGTFAATVNADLRVGALEETITVTGATPTVDITNTSQQRVLSRDVLEATPANRVAATMAALVPGVTSGTVDVGGSGGVPSGGSLTVHGSRTTDVKILFNGVTIQTLEAGSTVQGVPNMSQFQELAVDTSTISAEQATGGVSLNLIPREGGNIYTGQFIANFANDSMQGSNFTQDLQQRGLATPNGIVKLWDVNPSFGGPVKKDRLWFFGTFRYNGAENGSGMFNNLNAYNPNLWTYVADTSHPALTSTIWKTGAVNFTAQLTPRNKVSVGYDNWYGCECALAVNATTAPESAVPRHLGPPTGELNVTWSAPISNRLLFEAALFRRFETTSRYEPGSLVGRPDIGNTFEEIRAFNATGLNAVTEQSSGITYRAVAASQISRVDNANYPHRVSLSYITGAHAFKFGYMNNFGHRFNRNISFDSPVAYRFNNGIPNQLTLSATPFDVYSNLDMDLGLFAQDKWALSRLTLSYGLRYDHFKISFPDQQLLPGLLVPNRNLTLPGTSGVNWQDITPKLGVAYDLFGNGKTALKASAGKYVAGQALRGSGPTAVFGDALNPINRTVTSTTRAWTDSNNNFIPDCDLTNTAKNGECAAMANPNFGTPVSGNTYDQALLSGWGHRGYNWEFTAGVQQELLPRVSLSVSYFRRIFGNFNIVDNRAVAASDYTPFSITAPLDPGLAGGGGYQLAGLYDLNPAKFGIPADNYITFADNYGSQTEHYNGIDITVNARTQAGLFLQGGLSTGRSTTDFCDVGAKVPEALFGLSTSGVAFATGGTPAATVWTPLQYCHQQSPFLNQLKFLGSYTVPKVDVQVSGTFQSYPGPLVSANYTATNAVVAPSLGRPLSGNAANITVNLVDPGAIYGERRNQLDLRVAKILKYGRTRSTVGIDLYNALNANPVLTQNDSYAVWQRPTSILTARFVKFGVQLDF